MDTTDTLTEAPAVTRPFVAGARAIAPLVLDTSPFGVAIGAALVVNARFAVYSAGLAPWIPTSALRQRLLLALPLVDQVFLTATTAFRETPTGERDRRAYHLGAAVHFGLAWFAAETLGVLVGDHLPEWLGLHAASLLALVGLLATTLTTVARTATLAAAAVAPAGSRLPAHSAVLVATITGITAGGWRRQS